MKTERYLIYTPRSFSLILIGIMLITTILGNGFLRAESGDEQILSVLQITPADDFEPSGPVGGPFAPLFKDYQLTNTGASSIYWGVDNTVDWVDLYPTWGLLDPNESRMVTVSLNTIAETLPEGLHTDTVTFTDISNGVEQTRGVNLTVNSLPPGVLEVTPLDDFESSGEMGGPFAPSSKEYQLANTGDSPLTWGAAITEDWLDLDLTWGELEPNESTVVTVSLNSEADTLPTGIYTDTITITDMTNIAELTRDVVLNVTAPGGLWVVPGSFDVNTVEGCSVTETLTIGNNNPFDLDFMIRTRQVADSGGLMKKTKPVFEKNEDFSGPGARDFTVPDSNAPYKPGELIVRFARRSDGRSPSLIEKNNILKSLGGGTVKGEFGIVPGLSVVKLPGGLTVEEGLKTYNNVKGILYAEANYEVKICSTFPDDPRFDDLWGMHNTGQTGGTDDADIDAPEAWDIGTGSDEIIVAVIDTGVDYTHPDLADNMWTNDAELNGNPGEDDDGNGYIDDIYGYDFCNYDPDPMDDHYHGTHCSGTIGGIGDNGEGVAGVCWNVRIMALKFLSSGGSGWTDDAIKCVEYSTLMGANLSSNSWGGGGYSQGLKDVIDAAGAAGMLFVAAAGNSGSNNDSNPHYPSSYTSESVVAVMATDEYDDKASFSCYGPVSVDLGAPGVDILSCQLGGGYRYASGTSMATPHVAGACALLWSMNPGMSNSEVKDILLETVDPTLPGLCVSEGRLNLYNAILETKAPWIEIVPETGTILSGQFVDVSVTFDAIELEPGTYQAEILIFSDDEDSPEIIPVTMTVNMDSLQVAPREGFESSGPKWGPFEPGCKNYTLTNISSLPVEWTTYELQDWLELSQYGGTLGPYESIEVDVCISPDANILEPNIYTDTLIFQNLETDSIKPRLIELTVRPPDCFTELFDDRSDTHFSSLTFAPNGSSAYYEACRKRVSEFPTDPNGGIYVPLWDDDFAEIVLASDANVLFYGQSYDRFYIGSNGYITFGQGDVEYYASLESHFDLPRISALFADLTPQNNHSISYKQLGDRVAVTYENVPVFGDKETVNSFQIEMFFADGSIRVTWLGMKAIEAAAGLSEGKGIPALFEESDLSGYVPCWPCGDVNKDYFVGLSDLHIFVLHWLESDCQIPYWCHRTDLDFSSTVDFVDLSMLASSWHAKNYWWLQPVSHWEFEEGQGDMAYDSIGSNHGTLMGEPNWVAGKIGDYALDFDGVDDYVVIPDDDSLNPSEEITIAFWLYNRGGKDAGIYKYASCPSEPASPDNSRSYVVEVDYSESYKVRLTIFSSVGNYDNLFSESAVGLNDWHHIAATFDQGEAKIYIDGVLDNSKTMSVSSIMNDGQPFIFGGLWDYCGSDIFKQRMNGILDDVRIYDRTLSPEEISELYGGSSRKAFAPHPADGQTGVDPNIVLSWSPGKDTLSHDVYLGTSFDDVNDADPNSPEYMGNYASNSYDPDGLEVETTYYWRIDEKTLTETVKGDVWSFTTLDLSPSSWWEFEEGSGTIAYDSAGGNHGTLVGGPTWVAGKVGDYALDFDGVDDHVTIPDDDSLTPSEEITIAFWLYNRGGEDAGIYKYASCPGEPASPHNSRSYMFYVDYSESYKVRLSIFSSVSNYDHLLSENAVGLNDWHHIAATFDQGAAKIYVDGVPDGSGTMSVSSIMNDGQPLIFGGLWDYCGSDVFKKQMNGILDDVRIYDRELSDQEIWALYQQGL